jgi:integrase
MGLGPIETVSLADARRKAAEARKLTAEGVDPLETRDASRRAAVAERARGMTFDEARDAYIAAHRSGWRSAQYAGQWKRTVEMYASPVLGGLPVEAVGVTEVTRVLDPIWPTMRVTAAMVRARIEQILDWATARGLRSGENPARWRGHLKNLYPAVRKGRRVEHHEAMPYPDVGAFMARLRDDSSTAALALQFIVLTGVRKIEALGAQWSEIDTDGQVWTIPADRMKGNRAHRVPLSAPAIAVLHEVAGRRESNWVFPGDRGARVSKNAPLCVIERMGANATVHGFRSSFRDWAAECTNFPREICEAALAHLVGDETERAYARGDLFAKRRRLMDAWGEYVSRPQVSGTVTRLRRGA